MLKLVVYLKSYRKECIFGPAFKLFEAILELLLPTIMALIVNNGINKHDQNYVLKMGGLMVFLAVLGFCSAFVCQFLASRASQGFGTDLRDAVFEKISSMSFTQLDQFGTSTLINRVTNDINQLQQWVAMLIRLVIRAPFLCIGAMIMSMILDFKLSLILLLLTPIIGVIIYLITRYASPLYRNYQKKLDAIALILRENLSGVRVIRAFAKTNYEKNRFGRSNDSLTQTGFAIGFVSSLLNPITSMAVNAAIVAILWAGSYHVNTGILMQGQIIAFINYVTQILLSLIIVSNLIILFTKSLASAGRINQVLETQTLPQAKESPGTGDGSVKFENVSFGYNATGEMVLSDINVTIEPGQTFGIIGGTGSGKSTFVNLIPRFYDVTKGCVYVGGVPVEQYPPEQLRAKIGIVPQKAVLFTGTVGDNIRWGKQDASDEEVIEAAKMAQAHEFIMGLPEGYHTKITRGGTNLSGGQRQRITIARALAARPDILILDDSTSALDYATDARVRSALMHSSRKITVILVSQRVGTVKNANKILVLDDGTVAGCGTHEELLKTCGVYQDICYSQFSQTEAAQ